MLWVLVIVHRWVERIARCIRRLGRRSAGLGQPELKSTKEISPAPDGEVAFRTAVDRLRAHGISLRGPARRDLARFRVLRGRRDLEVRLRRDPFGNAFVVLEDARYLGGVCEEFVGGRCPVCDDSREAEGAFHPAATPGAMGLVPWVVLIVSSVMLLAVGALLWSGCGRQSSARTHEMPMPERVSLDFSTGATGPGSPYAVVAVVLERRPGAGLEGRAAVTTAGCFTAGARRVEKVSLTEEAWSAFASAAAMAAERGGHDALDVAAADAALAPLLRHLGLGWIGGFLAAFDESFRLGAVQQYSPAAASAGKQATGRLVEYNPQHTRTPRKKEDHDHRRPRIGSLEACTHSASKAG
jgi:hypothetical protein